MTSASANIYRLASGFIASGEPVSFYDAFELVRLARRDDALTDQALNALITLYDHAATTVGGRGILADFLRAYGQRVEKERGRAGRVLGVRDSGQTVRATAGAVVRLSVAGSDVVADLWTLERLDGPAQLTRLSPAQTEAEQADFALELLAPGEVVLELTAPPASRPSKRPALRELALRVVVESAQR